MKLSKYVKLVKGGGYCMVAHVEDSGIWLGTSSGYAGKGMGESSF